MELMNENESNLFRMEIDEPIKSNMLEMARWTKFLAIVGFVFMGLMLFLGLLVGTLAGSLMSNYFGGLGGVGAIGIIFVFVIIISLYFYPTLALFKYSKLIRQALITNNKELFYMAMNWLKNMFKYMGILMIIVLSLYGIQLIFALIIGISR